MQNEDFQNVGNPITSTPSPSPTSQSYQYESPPKRRSPKRFLYLLALVLLVLVVFNILRFLGSKKESAPTPGPTPKVEELSPTQSPESTVEPTPTPTPTPKPSPVNSIDKATGLDRKDLSLEVQNGSGQGGVAKKAADFLKSLGYNVIKTENADNFNYVNVTIKVKPTEKDFLPLLNKDLSSQYSIGTTSSDLTATSSADALVIVGK